MTRPIHHKTAQRALENAIADILILDGRNIGPSGSSWKDVAGTAAVNLRIVAAFLDQAREQTGPFRIMVHLTDSEVDGTLIKVI